MLAKIIFSQECCLVCRIYAKNRRYHFTDFWNCFSFRGAKVFCIPLELYSIKHINQKTKVSYWIIIIVSLTLANSVEDS